MLEVLELRKNPQNLLKSTDLFPWREQLFEGQCVQCPQPERCAEGVCVGNSEGVGCTGPPQGDAASDTAALLAIRAVDNNAAHPAMVTWTAGTEPCDAASWSEETSGWLGVTQEMLASNGWKVPGTSTLPNAQM